MSLEILLKHRRVWQEKPILRKMYRRWYVELVRHCRPSGKTLEIGGGGGNLKSVFPEIICSDYTLCPWLDLNLDAHHLPFASGSLQNIIVIDVLHHLAEPLVFIREAGRVLGAGGRLVMLEPCISPWSYPVYKYFHQEDVDFSYDVFSEEPWAAEGKQPFDGNMAIPTQMFVKNIERFSNSFPEFTVLERIYSDYFVYPLSGGFDHPSIIPIKAIPFCMGVEKVVRSLGSVLAYRLLVVLEKSGTS